MRGASQGRGPPSALEPVSPQGAPGLWPSCVLGQRALPGGRGQGAPPRASRVRAQLQICSGPVGLGGGGLGTCVAPAHSALCLAELQDIMHISRARKPAFILSSMRDEKRT